MNRCKELTAGYKKTSVLAKEIIGEKRHFIVSSLLKTQATLEDIYYVSIPALNPNQCIIPDTMAISFKFTNSNTKSLFLKNLGRLLVDRLSIKVQGVEVYQNTGKYVGSLQRFVAVRRRL